MGIYSGVDQKTIKIETVTTNNLPINYFLKPDGSDVKLASGSDNSLCNLISWKIMKLINKNLLNSRYTFLHIPKQLPSYKAVSLIEQMLVIVK